jgi:hypothetical protein
MIALNTETDDEPDIDEGIDENSKREYNAVSHPP